jgi:hypothetical protein
VWFEFEVEFVGFGWGVVEFGWWGVVVWGVDG